MKFWCLVSFDVAFSLSSVQEPGDCTCKANVIGKKCDQCKLGAYDLNENHETGCLGTPFTFLTVDWLVEKEEIEVNKMLPRRKDED